MRCVSFLTSTFLFLAAGGLANAAVPPQQPEQGAGGKDYQDSTVVKRAIGTAEQPIFVFHGASSSAKPRPVIVFFHSWGGNDPQFFGGWIEHLVRKGNVVIFPRFQEIDRTRPQEATAIASRMTKMAFQTLGADHDVHPDLNKVIFVGYLAGSVVALDLAAEAKSYELPMPKLVLSLMPGGVAKDGDTRGIPMPDLSHIDASTMLITMNGDLDHAPGDRIAKRILQETTSVPSTRKLFMRVSSDRHGYPLLSATLVSPGSNNPDYAAEKIPLPPSAVVEEQPAPVKVKGKRAQQEKKPKSNWSPDMALTGTQTTLTMQLGTNGVDNLDYRAFWKTLDMASEAAFAGKDTTDLKANPAFVDMGIWSDGWPVRRLGSEIPKGDTEAAAEPAPRRRF